MDSYLLCTWSIRVEQSLVLYVVSHCDNKHRVELSSLVLRDTADRLESDLTCPPAQAPAATPPLPQAKKGPSVYLCPSLPAGCGDPKVVCSVLPIAHPFDVRLFFPTSVLQAWKYPPINLLATRPRATSTASTKPTTSCDEDPTVHQLIDRHETNLQCVCSCKKPLDQSTMSSTLKHSL